jgi:hypothetical protein
VDPVTNTLAIARSPHLAIVQSARQRQPRHKTVLEHFYARLGWTVTGR